MKKIKWLLLILIIYSCDNNVNKTVEAVGPPKTIPKTFDTLVKSRDKIIGAWRLPKVEYTSFVITKNTIRYTESFTSYKYKMEHDSVKINFGDYTSSFHVVTKGTDTLILTGDEKQMYIRVKK